jgi:hypothetical protein
VTSPKVTVEHQQEVKSVDVYEEFILSQLLFCQRRFGSKLLTAEE